jgi:hypothetical protein
MAVIPRCYVLALLTRYVTDERYSIRCLRLSQLAEVLGEKTRHSDDTGPSIFIPFGRPVLHTLGRPAAFGKQFHEMIKSVLGDDIVGLAIVYAIDDGLVHIGGHTFPDLFSSDMYCILAELTILGKSLR